MGPVYQSLFSEKSHATVFGVAGSRKTSLAIKLAEEVPALKVIYISFGKENTRSARARFGSNTKCYNIHSLARRTLNIDSSRIIDRVSMQVFVESLSALGLTPPENHLIEASTILLEHFLTCGLPLTQLRKLTMHADFIRLTPVEKQQISFFVTQFWLGSFGNYLPVSHDMYLKEASLTPFKLDADILIIDEFQDLNDAMYFWVDNMIISTPNIKSVKLGDPTQQIFSFLGASERCLFEKPTRVLTSTYRFGSKLVDTVNRFMSKHPLPYYSPMGTKSDRVTTVEFYGERNEILKRVDALSKMTILSQYNLTLWQWMVELAEKEVPFYVLGHLQNSEKVTMQSLHKLYHTGSCSILQWQIMGYQSVKASFKDKGDRAALLACQFVESMPYDKHALFDRVLYFSKDTQKKAKVLLSTVHQAKGLEFSHVVVADDLPGGSCEAAMLPSEVHRIYTTLTRAKESILLPCEYFSKLS